MTTTDFSTGDRSLDDQFEAWREWFWPVFEIAPRQSTSRKFFASNKVWDVAGLVVSAVSAPATVVSRGRANVIREPVDHWILALCKNGETTLQTEDALVTVPPAVPYLWSLGRTATVVRPAIDRIQIILPRDAFRDIAPALDASSGTAIEGSLGRVLGNYMISLERWLPHLRLEDRTLMKDAIREMVAGCLLPTLDTVKRPRNETNGLEAERLRQAVRHNLKSPALSPEMLCRTTGISRSSLYRIFEPHGGIAHYIQRERLQAAFAQLSDPHCRRSVFRIGEDYCFSEASSFSRAFKHEFGCSPSDVRAVVQEGGENVLRLQPRPAPDSVHFGDLLRSA